MSTWLLLLTWAALVIKWGHRIAEDDAMGLLVGQQVQDIGLVEEALCGPLSGLEVHIHEHGLTLELPGTHINIYRNGQWTIQEIINNPEEENA